MTDEERRAEMAVYREALKDALFPLLSSDGGNKGIVAIRLFYAVNHGDDTVSGGNVGATAEGNVEAGLMLLKNIWALAADIQGNREYEMRETPLKS